MYLGGQCPRRPEEGEKSIGAGVTGSYVLPQMGAGKRSGSSAGAM